MPSHPVRRALTWLHRHVGLTLALFLIVSGLSGATLGFREELDALTFPALPSRSGPILDPVILAERIERQHPELQIMYLPLEVSADHAHLMFVAPRPLDASLPYDEIFVDPRTGEMLGHRNWSGPVRGFEDVMPFVFRLHYTLGFGESGAIVMGWVALIWTLDCFVGFYLTLPLARSHGWLRGWSAAWRVRRRTTPYKLNFDLHRAAGLWLWPMLFVLAWSSVGMRLQQVYHPVMQALLPTTTRQEILSEAAGREISWSDAREAGRRAMAHKASQANVETLEEVALRYSDWDGQIRYIVRSTLDDVEAGRGETVVVMESRAGDVIGFISPVGRRSGDVAVRWFGYLHSAYVFGRPYDILLAVTGLAMAMLPITGIVIWWKKRKARAGKRRRMRLSGRNPDVAANLVPASPPPVELIES